MPALSSPHSEIEKIIEERQSPEESELQEVKQQLLLQHQEYADVFSKLKSDEQSPRRELDHQIRLDNKPVDLGYCLNDRERTGGRQSEIIF